jgi:hypothetical protein
VRGVPRERSRERIGYEDVESFDPSASGAAGQIDPGAETAIAAS